MPAKNSFWTKMKGFSVSPHNHLMLNGVDLVDMARLSERPIYVLNELAIRENIQAYRNALTLFYPKPTSVFYASKAFLNLAMGYLLQQEQIGIDVCSEGELFIAQKAHIPSDHIILHGNNKSEQELTLAVESNIHRIIVDNHDELVLLEKICSRLRKKCHILLRINPSIEVKAHKYNATGTKESKFGFYTDQNKIPGYLKNISASPYVIFKGIHFHIGSNIYDVGNHKAAIDVMIDYLSFLNKNGIKVEDLNIGGGLGIPYQETDMFPDIHSFVKEVCHKIIASCEYKGVDLPCLMLEPGRSIVGQTGCTLYKIGSIKEGPEGVRYAAVNGGMSDNLRPALYQAGYTAVVANKMNQGDQNYPYKIIGKCCETGDVLIQGIRLPFCEAGDILVVFSTGAYHHSLASNYNKHTLPGTIFVRDKEFSWVSKEQGLEDLIQHDLIPDYLRGP